MSRRGACGLLVLCVTAVLSAACGREAVSLARLNACPDVAVRGDRVLARLDETAMHDIAFRIGCGGAYWIAVLDQGRRTGVEQQVGDVSAVELTPPWNAGRIVLRGTVEPAPYPEATYSWNLTDPQRDVLAARGAFIRLTQTGIAAVPAAPALLHRAPVTACETPSRSWRPRSCRTGAPAS